MLRLISQQQRRGLAVKAQAATAAASVKEKQRALIDKMRAEWKSPYVEYKSRRSGVLAMKMGMIQLYDAAGNTLPCTVLKLEDVVVVQHRTVQTHGYTALQLGAGAVKIKHVPTSRLGEFVKLDVEAKRHLEEFRVSPDAMIPVGTRIGARHFVPGQKVDITGITIGKGFQGPMKRWGFSGFPGSHGTSLTHRSLGSTGCRQDPGKVWPGKKMAGRMGNRQRTVQNVRLVAIDPVRDLLFCLGQVPGKPGNLVRVSDAIKLPMQFRNHNMALPFPTHSGPAIQSEETGPSTWLFDPAFGMVKGGSADLLIKIATEAAEGKKAPKSK